MTQNPPSLSSDGRALQFKQWLDAAAAIALIVAALVVIWSVTQQPPRTTSGRPTPPNELSRSVEVGLETSLAGVATVGLAAAPIAVLLFSDFECPFCAIFARESAPEIVRTLVKNGQVLLAFRHLPIESRHPYARKAAEAAVCAGKQGQFWKAHDLFFSPQEKLKESISNAVGMLELDIRLYQQCLQNDGIAAVDLDVLEAKRLRVTGTPTFFFGQLGANLKMRISKRQSGALTVDRFSDLVREVGETGG